MIANIDGELRGIISEMISKEVKLQLEVMKLKESLELMKKKKNESDVTLNKVRAEYELKIATLSEKYSTTLANNGRCSW